MKPTLRQTLDRYEALQSLVSPDARAMLEAMKGQLLIVLIERLGGSVDIPASEIDSTGGKVMTMQVLPDGKTMQFAVTAKPR